ncbi:SDR family NAD(P)-dependent oxidoreductase [Pedobacter flavus]|uniref:SDR family oxidoreductase n=1 Tax=Pedobacter flavus TaxID=3113906 RepID=A0ABU7GXW2_9SPHI|nr:SDR family oxidoreductase [Pedobacter sp. VNH31]MEE1883857.1 SDR family oxidoreductase [Pedobacter sp. VNH31]
MNIIVTGASSGIGFETVLELALQKGHKIMAIARNADKLRKLLEIAKGLNPDCELYPVSFDLTKDNFSALTPLIEDKFGKVDILINNAGALVNKPFLETTEEDLYSMLQTNVVSHFVFIQQIYQLFNTGAHIVNIGSMGGFQGSEKFPGLSAYSSSKAALHVLTECLAAEFKEQNIKVNCLALGSAQTEMLEAAFPGYESPVLAFEMGKYVADFALKGHKFFNGKILPVALTTP